MKKLVSAVAALLFLILAGTSLSGDFSPTVMAIKGSAKIGYSFDGKDLKIPFTLTGTPAAVWLVINTKDKGYSVNNVRNGYLGWHYVNKIDTTIYISPRYGKNPGNNVIVWDGKDEDGNLAVPGAYNYYLWAYDDKTPRQTACSFIQIGFSWDTQFTHIIEKGSDGKPLSNPILFGARPWYDCQPDPNQADYTYRAHGTVAKWALGSDPYDASLIQTTRMGVFDDAVTDLTYGGPTLDPRDNNIFYNVTRNFTQKVSTINKWDFVSDGMAIQDVNWGNWENITLEDHGVTNGKWSQQPGTFTDGNYIYQVSPGLQQKEEEWDKLRAYSFEDGHIVIDKMMHEWYMPDDPNPGKFINGAFHNMYSRTPNNWFLLSHTSCLFEMINTSRLVYDQDDETDMILFRNSNGDYFMDTAYTPTVEPHWYCLSDDNNVTKGRSSIAIDRNGFNIIGVSYLGITSFGVSTQDGSGIGMMSFADCTLSEDKNLIGGGLLVDNGGSFDGLYFIPPILADTPPGGSSLKQTTFVASDSFHGVISGNTYTYDFIGILAPNGGERLVPGGNYEIKWGSWNPSRKVKIEYSTDKGSTWKTVTEVSDTTASYLWRVPDVISSGCLIKISDAYNNSVFGISDNFFAIGNSITLISPNGSEKYKPNELKDIRWTSAGVANVKIEYSPDNGSSWSVIAESAPSNGACEWTLPDIQSDSCLIRITDTEHDAVSDVSEHTFSILDTSLILLSPNGGEEWETKQTCSIKWYSYNISNIKIEISYDNGTTWSIITKSTDAKKGNYLWKVAGNPSEKCLIKISDTGSTGISDISDSAFTIAPLSSIWTAYNEDDGITGYGIWAVAADKKGGVWAGSSERGVYYFNGLKWTSYNNIPSINISAIAVDNGGIVWFGPKENGGLFSYDGISWNSIQGCPSSIRQFVIDKNNVKWVAINGSESYNPGLYSYDGIAWKNIQGIKSNYIQALSIDVDNTLWVGYETEFDYGFGVSHFNGSSWTHYTSADGLSSDEVRAIAFGPDGKKWFGTSNGVSSFDGVKWTTYRTSDGLINNDVCSIAIDLEGIVWVGTNGGVSFFDGIKWKSYTSGIGELPNDLVWKIAVDKNNVKWFATGRGGVASFSYHYRSHVILNSPNGGDLWQTGSTHDITWLSRDVERINIEYSKDNGVTWNLIAGSVDASLKSYKWKLPVTASEKCKIRLTDTSNLSVNDESNGVFIISDPFVRIIYPNGGEILPMGSMRTVKWLSIGVAQVKIEYSIDDGLTWLGLATLEASDSLVLWQVPNYESVHCLMRITDDSFPERTDLSDSVFTMFKSYITVGKPRGGVEWPGRTNQMITWRSEGVEKVKIEYSLDNGISWNLIVNNIFANYGMYIWNVPPVKSAQCRIRISEQDRPEIFGINDNPFSITDETTDVKTDLPKEFSVSQNMPNLFNPSTTINVSIPNAERVNINIYNLSGQKVRYTCR